MKKLLICTISAIALCDLQATDPRYSRDILSNQNMKEFRESVENYEKTKKKLEKEIQNLYEQEEQSSDIFDKNQSAKESFDQLIHAMNIDITLQNILNLKKEEANTEEEVGKKTNALMPYKFRELTDISREPNDREKPIIQKTVDYFGSHGTKIDEVRLFDAQSAINYFSVPEPLKSEILKLTDDKNAKAATLFICNFFSKSIFSDDDIREKVLNTIYGNCCTSKTFRHLMLAKAADLLSSVPTYATIIANRIFKPARKMRFKTAKSSSGNYKLIRLKPDFNFEKVISFFPDLNNLVPVPNTELFKFFADGETFFHEMGHSLSYDLLNFIFDSLEEKYDRTQELCSSTYSDLTYEGVSFKEAEDKEIRYHKDTEETVNDYNRLFGKNFRYFEEIPPDLIDRMPVKSSETNEKIISVFSELFETTFESGIYEITERLMNSDEEIKKAEENLNLFSDASSGRKFKNIGEVIYYASVLNDSSDNFVEHSEEIGATLTKIFHIASSLVEYMEEDHTDYRFMQEQIFRDQFLNLREFFQIHSWALLQYDNKTILFGNLLGDLAFAAEKKFPIKATHLYCNKNNKLKMKESYSVNLDYYGVVLPLFGTTLHNYIMSLIYGDSIISYWKTEFSLGKTRQVSPQKKQALFAKFTDKSGRTSK